MTTTIPALDFYLAGVASACLLAGLFAARQWIVRHLGRARPLPDLPQRDEASAPESMTAPVVVRRVPRPPFNDFPEPEHCDGCRCTDMLEIPDFLRSLSKPAPMQGNAQAKTVPLYDGDWPKHFYSDDLPRRA